MGDRPFDLCLYGKRRSVEKRKKAHQKSSEPFLGTFLSSSQKNISKGNIIPVSSDDVTFVAAATPYFSDNQEREKMLFLF
jgi:hypothetical protein